MKEVSEKKEVVAVEADPLVMTIHLHLHLQVHLMVLGAKVIAMALTPRTMKIKK